MHMMTKRLVFVCMVLVVTGGYALADGDGMTQQLIEGNNSFALDLYGKLCREEGNIFFSPYSISSALAMTYAGARGETASQMADTLHFIEHADLHNAFSHVTEQLEEIEQAGNIALAIANALWVQKDYNLLEEFVELVTRKYGAGIFPIDFAEAYKDARDTINAWVEEQTNQRIRDLLAQGTLNGFTRLVLINAIYFKGNWELPFEEDNTAEEPFWVTPEKDVQAAMMQQQQTFKYGEIETAQILHMPYAGEELSMVIVLPKARDGLQTLEQELTKDLLSEWRESASMRDVKVWLPKFTITSQFNLADTLQEMGMIDAFSEKADFSGIAGSQQLALSHAIHKAFVEVNEEGTEATAATAVMVELTSIQEPEPVPEFRADHPFLFLIQENQTGSILFLGRVVKP
ncbi:hypothetical protein CSA56_07195 [candidate division KSB3 bacterium]|uniref:Serpin domain-containing protein n=1 Tax=candidate division KSB3 bacterium TaxID=2044937 RepID=A0A2G6KG24_9BACT|nr:MAG: hypothetical protein CSA56_07195 [candidate division KSB3 bacterium]